MRSYKVLIYPEYFYYYYRETQMMPGRTIGGAPLLIDGIPVTFATEIWTDETPSQHLVTMRKSQDVWVALEHSSWTSKVLTEEEHNDAKEVGLRWNTE